MQETRALFQMGVDAWMALTGRHDARKTLHELNSKLVDRIISTEYKAGEVSLSAELSKHFKAGRLNRDRLMGEVGQLSLTGGCWLHRVSQVEAVWRTGVPYVGISTGAEAHHSVHIPLIPVLLLGTSRCHACSEPGLPLSLTCWLWSQSLQLLLFGCASCPGCSLALLVLLYSTCQSHTHPRCVRPPFCVWLVPMDAVQ